MEGELSMKSILWCIRGMSAPLQQLVTESPEVVKGRDRWGDSLLHYAAQYGYLNVVRVLLGAHADPNALNHAGSSPLHKAALGGHNAIAVALLGAGALPHHVNSNGHLPESVCRWPTTRAILTGNDSIMRIKMIEGEMIPLVIGKQGTTIKVIQMKSGTSIERAKEEEGGGKRGGKGAGKFIITGRPEAVERAFTLLDHCLNNNGLLPEGLPPASQLMAELKKENIVAKTAHFPLDEHPFLIGKGGEKLNSVQQKNKVKVFIPHKASLSTAITIVGQKEEDLASALAEMESILAPKRKNEAMVKESLQVPRKCHSIIIGKSYSNLKELTEKTGVKVLVPSFDSLSEILILRGLPEEITAAIEFIRNLLKEELKEQIDVNNDIKIITASTYGETVNTTISLSQVKRRDLLDVGRRARVEEEEGVSLKVSEESVLVTGPIENVNRMVKRFSGATGMGMGRGRGGGKREKEEDQVLKPQQQRKQRGDEKLKRLIEKRKGELEEERYQQKQQR